MHDSQIRVSITHVSTACILLKINGATFITDPVFSLPHEYDISPIFQKFPMEAQFQAHVEHVHASPIAAGVKCLKGPALQLRDLPPVDAVLLSHEDHPDNLDIEGRKLLEGRKVFTTVDGMNQLAPRPGVVGLKPWSSVQTTINGMEFTITGTPCRHFPGGECTGFVLETPGFGTHTDGRPNAIWISGDTIDCPELMDIGKRWHMKLAVVHLGKAETITPLGPVNLTLGAKAAIDLMRHFQADVMVPVHMDSWSHFTESSDDVKRIVKEEGFDDRTRFLQPGIATLVAEF